MANEANKATQGHNKAKGATSLAEKRGGSGGGGRRGIPALPEDPMYIEYPAAYVWDTLLILSWKPVGLLGSYRALKLTTSSLKVGSGRCRHGLRNSVVIWTLGCLVFYRIFKIRDWAIDYVGKLSPEKLIGVVWVGQVGKEGSRVLQCSFGVHNNRVLRLQFLF